MWKFQHVKMCLLWVIHKLNSYWHCFFLFLQELKDLTQRNECLDLKGKRQYISLTLNSTCGNQQIPRHLFTKLGDSLYQCMSLGEKLDYKACESLEEILKRVQFKVIDLEQTNLEEDVRRSCLWKLSPSHSRPSSSSVQLAYFHLSSITHTFSLCLLFLPPVACWSSFSLCTGRMSGVCHGFSDYSRCPLV